MERMAQIRTKVIKILAFGPKSNDVKSASRNVLSSSPIIKFYTKTETERNNKTQTGASDNAATKNIDSIEAQNKNFKKKKKK